MKLSERTIEVLAEMVVGDADHFPYRSSSYITQFFKRCGLPFEHDGTTRPRWAQDRLSELNLGAGQYPDLPSDDLCRVISELLNPDEFERYNSKLSKRGDYDTSAFADFDNALASFNRLVHRQGLVAYVDEAGRCYLRSTGTRVSSADLLLPKRPLSQEEIAQRQKLAAWLDGASEDDAIERVLVPLFQRLGFRRVSVIGQKDRHLEYGKDVWMKFQLPTGHWLYFCMQVKIEKIDSAASSGYRNVSTLLNQARMAIDSPIFDPESNRKFLLDHIFIVSTKEITKAARAWLVAELDKTQRRHLIFMDREEFLDHAARILLDLQIHEPAAQLSDYEIPF